MSLPRPLAAACGPFLLVLLLAFAAADAPAATKKPRCPAGATALGTASAPRACLPPRATTPAKALEAVAVALTPKPPRGAKRNKKLERRAAALATQVAALKAAGGRILPEGTKVARRQMARAAGADPLAALNAGSTESYESNGVNERGTFRDGAAEYRIEGTDGGAVLEARDRNGAGATLGIVDKLDVPRCPAGDGQLPAKHDYTFTFGRAAAVHGKRYWFLVTMKVDGPWKGHVGVGAKVETYDFDLRAAVEIRAGVEIAATGKALKREPTRTYRAALTKSGIPIATPVEQIARDMRLRGPKGARAVDQKELEAFGSAAYGMGIGLGEILSELRKGDERWYDQRACATLDSDASPEHVVPGGAGDFDVWVRAADGTPVSASQWTPRADNGTCGTMTWSPAGPDRARFHVADTARAWDWDPSVSACAQSEVTTPAGRPRVFERSIFVEPPAKYAYTIKVTYGEDMGPGIARTDMTGSGSVTLEPGQAEAMGSGSYTGAEWDGGVGNPCGDDMQRSRTFSGEASVGATANDDGTVTVAYIATARALRMSWLIVLAGPGQGKVEHITAKQPFCGEAGRAATTADVVVTATKVG